jgi:hypothetical protein
VFPLPRARCFQTGICRVLRQCGWQANALKNALHAIRLGIQVSLRFLLSLCLTTVTDRLPACHMVGHD